MEAPHLGPAIDASYHVRWDTDPVRLAPGRQADGDALGEPLTPELQSTQSFSQAPA